MICLIALIVFGILGIFSAKYRIIAKDAFDCVFKRLTLRKCDTGLDQRLKSQITGNLMRRHYGIGSWVFRNFEILSWIFTIMLVVSLGYSAYGAYNYVKYGNCNGPLGGVCVFDAFNKPKIGETSIDATSLVCSNNGDLETPGFSITGTPTTYDDQYIGPENASVVVIEVGCYQCPRTKEAQPVVKDIIKEYEGKIKFVFVDFPIENVHPDAQISAEATECADEQGKFWEYGDKLFENQNDVDADSLIRYAKELSLNETMFSDCLNSGKYRSRVEQDMNESISLGIYGTPTFFVNDQIFVGPQTYKTFKNAIDAELAKTR